AKIEIRDIPTADENMSPMEIWCNESQERYVLAIDEKDVPLLDKICKRERCPYAIVGTATKEKQLILTDRTAEQNVVDIPMEVLFGKPPKLTKTISRATSKLDEQTQPDINLSEAIKRVLRIPAVGSKKFLITIGDRNVGGLTTRDQMIGP